LAKVNDTYVLHRVYQIKGKKIILRGDGNLEGYEVCKESDIIGRVVQVRKKGGKRKRMNKARVWRHLPTLVKKMYLKFYRHYIQWVTFYEN
jgi:hypothetical protein